MCIQERCTDTTWSATTEERHGCLVATSPQEDGLPMTAASLPSAGAEKKGHGPSVPSRILSQLSLCGQPQPVASTEKPSVSARLDQGASSRVKNKKCFASLSITSLRPYTLTFLLMSSGTEGATHQGLHMRTAGQLLRMQRSRRATLGLQKADGQVPRALPPNTCRWLNPSRSNVFRT